MRLSKANKNKILQATSQSDKIPIKQQLPLNNSVMYQLLRFMTSFKNQNTISADKKNNQIKNDSEPDGYDIALLSSSMFNSYPGYIYNTSLGISSATELVLGFGLGFELELGMSG